MGKRTAGGLPATHPAALKPRGHLAIRLFGHLEIALGGESTALATPRKSLQLLAYLWLHPGATVSREYLAFLLYPEDEEASARAKLRATLAELPKIFPAQAGRHLTIDADKVAWNRDSNVWIDVEAFLEAAADPTRLAEAIDLYRGDVLPEIYDEWLDVIRERLRNTYLRCLEGRVSEARRNANFALAIETARQLLAVDPWREDVMRRIIAIRYESGDRAGALREYAAVCKRLRDELGTEPMAETVALSERIAREQALAVEDVATTSVDPDRSTALPFVGRRTEMERLLETWNRVAHGRGGCAFVAGEIGIGKSRLALEFGHAVEERGGRVLLGMTGSPESVPYECVADALRSGLAMLASLKPDVTLASVATLLPELNGRVALPPPARLDAESERARLFESLFRCISNLATPRPLLLVLEDLHCAQAATIELLAFLLRRIAGARVMMLITYRAEEAPRLHALHRLRREARTGEGPSNIWLSGLSVAEVEELRSSLPEMRDHTAVTLAATSQGNPLFLTQLIADARDGAPAAAAPASLQDAVKRRIEWLSSDARTVAEIAACIGDRFSHDAIREVSGWEDAPLNSALDELFERRIVREASGGGFEYIFAHNLVQATIAQGIAPKMAVVRRRRIARVLEELYPERFSELSPVLAEHYQYAGDVANAARCYLAAVRRSIAIGAIEEGRNLCSRALALSLEARTRAHLLLESVTIEARRGDGEARSAALLQLVRTDADLADPAIHREVLLARIEFAATTGDIDAAGVAVRALHECVSDDDLVSSAMVHLAEANLEHTRGRLLEARAAGDAALACSRAANDPAGAARALCVLANIESHRGNAVPAADLFDNAARLAAEAGDSGLQLLVMQSGWTVAYAIRDFERCGSLGERCLELAVKLGDRHAEARTLGRLALIAPAGEARRYFAAATRSCEESGDKARTAAQLLNRAVMETKYGFFDLASSLTARASELFEQAGDERGRINALSNLTFLKVWMLDVAAARKLGERVLEEARRYGFRVLEASTAENLALAEAAAGDFERSIALAKESFELRSRSKSEMWSVDTLADVAIWSARCGDLPGAVDAVRQLLSDEKRVLNGSDWPSYCFWTAAQIFHLGGESSEAARLLQRARSIIDAQANELDSEDRASFLALAFNRDIVRAAETGVWPDLRARTPA